MTILNKNYEWIPSVLEKYNISPSYIIAVRLMREGIENDVIRVTLSDGLIIIIRRHLKNSVTKVEFECSILERIAGKFSELITPKLRYTIEGKSYLNQDRNVFTVYDYLQGSHPVISRSHLVHDLCNFAHLLQGITSKYEWINPLVQSNIFQIKELAFQFMNEYHHVLTIKETEALKREVAELVTNQKVLNKFPKVIVHGDLHAGNLLIDNCGKLKAILDFEDACIDYSILEFAGIARGHCFDDEYFFSLEKCQEIYFEAGSTMNQLCSFNEFVNLVKLFCFRNMLYIYDNKRNKNPIIQEQRLINQWLDFKRWINLDSLINFHRKPL